MLMMLLKGFTVVMLLYSKFVDVFDVKNADCTSCFVGCVVSHLLLLQGSPHNLWVGGIEAIVKYLSIEVYYLYDDANFDG